MQEGTTLKVHYRLGDSDSEHVCLVKDVKVDTKPEILEQQIRNTVIAHYNISQRWVGHEGTFEHDPSKKSTVVLPHKEIKLPEQ